MTIIKISDLPRVRMTKAATGEVITDDFGIKSNLVDSINSYRLNNGALFCPRCRVLPTAGNFASLKKNIFPRPQPSV